ncbi:MAG: molybdopterin-dependent oxidoreductase [Gammaproteobacteria bacterium]|jgi:phenylacetyl-CoA:acceptor oxidoreductase|nr:molybdopterin-dependent oxidoreductase [Gammaproteobacteria bacterium]
MNAETKPVSKKVPTYCYQCVNGPDLLTVEVVDGVATKVEPNFNADGVHPANGKVCVKAFGVVQKSYNPHRILNPLKRSNPKKGRDEDPGWVEISWEEALDTVATRMQAMRDKGLLDENGDARFAFSTGGAGKPMFYGGTLTAFLGAWGPIDFSLGAGGTVKCSHSEHMFHELWHRGFTVLADNKLSNLVLAFGVNVDASGGVTGVYRNANARNRGSKRYQFEPHLSVTGANATEWVPIKPQTDNAVLFSMIHVLLHERPLDDLDVNFLKHKTASPYLIAPNGYYLRDPETSKPLIWDNKTNSAVVFDTEGVDPALEGEFTVEGSVEIGADDERWEYENIIASPSFQALKLHMEARTPEWAESISDVPAAKIRELANAFVDEACIGQTCLVEGRELPLRPVAIVLGKTTNNGWGGYECVWARAVMQILVGALEVPGGLLGSTSLIVGPNWDRWASVTPGVDGFMKSSFNSTRKGEWTMDTVMRHAHNVITPSVGTEFYAPMLGSTSLSWLRLQGRGAESMPKPNPPDVWFVYKCNPIVSFSETDRIEETLSEFPFTVAFGYTHDETNHFADLILPEAVDLESDYLARIGGTHYMEQQWEAEGWGLKQRVIEPPGKVKDFAWICNQLAERLDMTAEYNEQINLGACGIPLKTDAYDFSLDKEHLHDPDEIWDAICKAASTDLSDGKETRDLDWFRVNGYLTRPFSSLHWYLYPKLEDEGLRFELPYQEQVYRMGQQLGNRLHENDIHWWDRQLQEYEALPEFNDLNKMWDEIVERNYEVKADDYPYWLLSARSMQFAWGTNAASQEMHEVASNIKGHDGIMIQSARAKELGIEDGDWIEVVSPVAKSRGQARLRLGMRPDVIVMLGQFGQWNTPFVKDLKIPSVNKLVPMNMDLLDGTGSSIEATKVSISRCKSAG